MSKEAATVKVSAAEANDATAAETKEETVEAPSAGASAPSQKEQVPKDAEAAEETKTEAVSEDAPKEEEAKADAPDAPDVADAPAEAEKKPKRKETKKRVRRVGKTEPRKVIKLDETATTDAALPATGGEQKEGDAAAAPAEGETPIIRRVLSKHDEKWNAMFDKLLAYKKEKNHTLVPQCCSDDPRLGRWVHYQRVEYWIYQQTGTGKITTERIARLENMGFEWDPQKAQWNMMFDKLLKFKETLGHCKVPKGYAKDTELANWVRNQRLEQANMKKGKKSRMTPERYEKLDKIGFKWSTTIAKKGASKSSNNKPKTSTSNGEEAAKAPPAEEAQEETAVKKEDAPSKDADTTTAAAGESTAAAAAPDTVAATKEAEPDVDPIDPPPTAVEI